MDPDTIPDTDDEIDWDVSPNPEIVHWQPAHRVRRYPGEVELAEEGEAGRRGAYALSPASALGLIAVGSAVLGLAAVGALAIGALAIGQLAVGRARFGRLEVDDLVIGKVHFKR